MSLGWISFGRTFPYVTNTHDERDDPSRAQPYLYCNSINSHTRKLAESLSWFLSQVMHRFKLTFRRSH